MPDLPEESPYEPGVMTFRIMKILPRFLNKPEFSNLKAYLRDDAHTVKLYQLSSKIADLFDQYLVFRPEVIIDWETGNTRGYDENLWQAHLWRALTVGQEHLHRARLRNMLFKKISQSPPSIDNLPQRVSIFGVSYLPPFHLQAYAAISRLTRVNLFILNPCKEYWFDIASDREVKEIKKYYAVKEIPTGYLHLERGNRLLASMGSLARDFMSLAGEFDSEIYEQFEDVDGVSMLNGVQSDILYLRDRRVEKKPDGSIQIHSCHSPLREMEVLYDSLLAMFEADRDLVPRDIVVMAPDIESYAPYVHIVFDTPQDGALRIPYSIADQSVKNQSRLMAGFLQLLDLKTSRFGAAQILNLLELPGIKEKFSLTDSEITEVERWIKDTNIRWGIDAEDRRRMGLPGYCENTWHAGVKRLLLGYALPGGDDALFKGVLPYGNFEGSETQIFGKFLEFFEKIKICRDNFQTPRSLTEWQSVLLSILDQLFLAGEALEPEVQFLRKALDDLARKENLAKYHEAIDLEVIRSHLEERLTTRSFGYGFLKGGVTFCSLLPMRSIPFKVICLVGMNSDAFPRDSRTLGFDLMAKSPRKGDRSRRNDDKYLFLESIISARETLYISYSGQNIQDNTNIPPSPLVSELLDVLEDGFGLTADQVTVRHRLQPFNPEYFKPDSNLFSYSKENLSAAEHLFDTPSPHPFISADLPPPADDWKSATIDQLCAFYRNPARYLLQQRLGIFFEEAATVSEERENFGLDNLLKYMIGQDLLQKRRAGGLIQKDLPIQMAKGVLPHGNVGRFIYGELSSEADAFVRKIEKFSAGESIDALSIDIKINGFHLSGQLNGVHRHRLVRMRYSNIKPKDLLASWIIHLALCSLEDHRLPQKTILLGKNSTWEFQPLDESRNILQVLLSGYWKGLSRPLPFFPESSYEYTRRRLTQKKTKRFALKAAGSKWLGSEFQRGEIEDPYFKRCFKHGNPLDDDFEKIAVEIFSPLLGYCREVFET
jgi:exodeoxyribonuclease V gamma subunit